MARTIDDGQFEDGFGGESADSSFGQLDLQHYLRILRKYKFAITLFTAVITALAGYYAYTATPIYKATAVLLIESQAENPISFEQLVGIENETGEYYETQYQLLESRALALRVVNKLDLWNHPEFNSSEVGSNTVSTNAGASSSVGLQAELQQSTGLSGAIASLKKLVGLETTATGIVLDLDNPEGAIESSAVPSTNISDKQILLPSGNDIGAVSFEFRQDLLESGRQFTRAEQNVLGQFQGRLEIAPVRKTKLVNITFVSTDPQLSALIANTVGEEYISSYLDAKVELTIKASSWMNERLTDLKAVLDFSEERLISFKQANGLVDVGGSVGRLNEQELLLATAELAQARSDLSYKEDLYRESQALKDNAALLGSVPSFQADSLIQRVKIDQGQAQRTLDELRNRYGERHPRVVDALSQLTTLNATLDGHVQRVVGSISKDFQLAQQRVASIEAKLNVGKTEIQAIGTKKFEIEALEREVATNRGIYDTFFSRITEAKSADGLEAANARISDYALTPQRPFKPKKQLIIALAALMSLVLSILMAFLYEQMDETVKGTADVEEKLGLKLLGILPLIKGGIFNRAQGLPLNPQDIPLKNKTFSEAVNTVRTAICLDDGDKPRKVIVITSSVPGEGKSTASINLAYSLAQIERVLLIDADMRRPTIAKAAGFEKNIPGLSNLITKTAPAHQCIVRGTFGGDIDILPSGPLPEQPLELLSSKRFEKILDQLSKHYDRIVIDCAPTQAVSDGLVLAKLSDAVVYVIKSHETSMELVKRGVERLRQVRAPLTGALITQVDIAKITAYGGDYYYQGYYDYYGYHDKEGSGKGQKKVGNRLRLSQEELLNIRTDDSDVELDLDYNYGVEDSSKRVESPSVAKSHPNGSNDSEFDRTSQIAEFSADSWIDPREAIEKPRRIKRDLDIL